MTKIIDYSTWINQQQFVGKPLHSKKAQPKAVDKNFGLKSVGNPSIKVARKQFYNNNLETYRFKRSFMQIIIDFFRSRRQKINAAIAREIQLKSKLLNNLNFIHKEALSINQAVSSKMPSKILLKASNPSDLEEVLKRNEELKSALEKLQKEFKSNPEIYVNAIKTFQKITKSVGREELNGKLNIKDPFKEIENEIKEISETIEKTRKTCSALFTDQIYTKMRGVIGDLKKAESPEEKKALRNKLSVIEQAAQSKAFLFTTEDREFLNVSINVADHLVQLSSSKKINYPQVLKEIYNNAKEELIDGEISELETIDDFDVLKRAVLQIDKKIEHLKTQWNFTSLIIEEGSSNPSTAPYLELQDILADELDDVVKRKEKQIGGAIEDYSKMKCQKPMELRRKERKRKKILNELEQFDAFIKFLGQEYIVRHKDVVNGLKDALNNNDFVNRAGQKESDNDKKTPSWSGTSATSKESTSAHKTSEIKKDNTMPVRIILKEFRTLLQEIVGKRDALADSDNLDQIDLGLLECEKNLLGLKKSLTQTKDLLNEDETANLDIILEFDDLLTKVDKQLEITNSFSSPAAGVTTTEEVGGLSDTGEISDLSDSEEEVNASDDQMNAKSSIDEGEVKQIEDDQWWNDLPDINELVAKLPEKSLIVDNESEVEDIPNENEEPLYVVSKALIIDEIKA